jgi:hypothetical protein
MQSDCAIVDLDRDTGARNRLQMPPFGFSRASSALNAQLASTLNWGLMLPGIGPTHRPVPCFPARVGPIPCADRLFRVQAKIKMAVARDGKHDAAD